MRISINQFVKEAAGRTGTLCAVLSEGTTSFPIIDTQIKLNSSNVSFTSDAISFSIPRSQIYSVEKTPCQAYTADCIPWTEYEITTVQGYIVTVDVQ